MNQLTKVCTHLTFQAPHPNYFWYFESIIKYKYFHAALSLQKCVFERELRGLTYYLEEKAPKTGAVSEGRESERMRSYALVEDSPCYLHMLQFQSCTCLERSLGTLSVWEALNTLSCCKTPIPE